MQRHAPCGERPVADRLLELLESCREISAQRAEEIKRLKEELERLERDYATCDYERRVWKQGYEKLHKVVKEHCDGRI